MQNALYSAGFAPPSTDEYKTKKLVLRKIEGGKNYTIGSTAFLEVTKNMTNTTHTVNVPKDYYIGIYELTESQYKRLNKESVTSESAMPSNLVSWNTIRGSAGVTAAPGNGPLYNLNEATGLTGFDLPTISMWEIAARAGQTTTYMTGETVDTSVITEYAWDADSAGTNVIKTVGLKLPNAWGIYDTLGNVWEYMRDVHTREDLATAQPNVFTPISTGTAANRIYAGMGNGNPMSKWPEFYTPSYRAVDGATASGTSSTGCRLSYVAP